MGDENRDPKLAQMAYCCYCFSQIVETPSHVLPSVTSLCASFLQSFLVNKHSQQRLDLLLSFHKILPEICSRERVHFLLWLTFLREEQMDEKDDSSESEEGTVHFFVVFSFFARRFSSFKVILARVICEVFLMFAFFCCPCIFVCFELFILTVANAIQFCICVFCNREYGGRWRLQWCGSHERR